MSVQIAPRDAGELRGAIARYVAVLDRSEDDPVRARLFPVGYTLEAQLLGEMDRYTMEDLLVRKLRRVRLVLDQLATSTDGVDIRLDDISDWRHVLREVVMVDDSSVAARLSSELDARAEWGR